MFERVTSAQKHPYIIDIIDIIGDQFHAKMDDVTHHEVDMIWSDNPSGDSVLIKFSFEDE